MHAEIQRPEPPPPPPAVVTLTLTEDEARKLRALMGDNGNDITRLHQRSPEIRRTGLTDSRQVGDFTSKLFYELARVVPSGGDAAFFSREGC